MADINKEKQSNSNKPKENNYDCDDYDPYKHRKIPVPTTNTETLIHYLKGCIGTGILAMPNAFTNCGYLVGVIATVLIGALSVYCMHMLLKSMYQLAKRERIPNLTYAQAMRKAFEIGPPYLRWIAPAARIIVDGFLAVYQIGIICIYVVFIASTMKNLCDYYLIDLDIKLHIVVIILPLMIVYSIRDLHHLTPLSAIANILIFIGLLIIFYLVCQDLPPLSERNMIINISNFPTFFSMVLFAIEAVGVVVALENNMEHPEDFLGICGVMNRGGAIVTILYAIFAFFGYWKYGQDTLGSITLNLSSTNILAEIIKISLAISIFLSYPLQGYIPMDILWHNFLKDKFQNHPRSRWIESGIRCAIVLFTIVAAIAIPQLDLFLSLIGALCLTLLGIAFPALMEICVKYANRDYGKYNFVLIKCFILIVLGVLILVVGVRQALSGIIDYYRAL